MDNPIKIIVKQLPIYRYHNILQLTVNGNKVIAMLLKSTMSNLIKTFLFNVAMKTGKAC